MTLLVHEYRKQLKADDVHAAASVDAFADFARKFLVDNPPVGLSHAVDQNYLITLKSNQTCTIAPSLPDGLLPDAGAVSCQKH